MWTPWSFKLGFSEAELFAVPAPGADAGPGLELGPLFEELTAELFRETGRPHRELSPALERLSRPYRTTLQLERLGAAPRPASEPFRFVVVGDAEPGRFPFWRKLFNEEGVFESQLERIAAREADFVIQLGDMVSRGLPENYERFLRSLSASGLEQPYLTVLGNHDRHYPHGRSDASLYRQLFGAPNYSFDRGGWRFVVLDTSEEGLTQARLRWLDRVLSTKQRKLVFTHKPPMQLTRWTAAGIGGFRKGSLAFTRLVSRHRVERVYMGHVHGFGVQEHRGVRYVLSGGGGSPLFPSGAPAIFHHHLVVEAGPRGLRETVVRLNGDESAVPPRN